MRKVAPEDVITIQNVSENVKAFKKTTPSKEVVDFFYATQTELEESLKKDGSLSGDTLLNKIYSFVDLYMSKTVYGYSECAKGCAYCCRYHVSTSRLEAYYIYEYIKDMPDIEFTNCPDDHASVEKQHYGYCTFLNKETGSCRIYPARPLNCRTYASIDGWRECVEPYNSHNYHSWASTPLLTHVRDLIDTITPNNIPNTDIRDWFKPSGK